MSTHSPVIEVRDVSKRFGGTQALDSVGLDLVAGEVHAFVGENGAGKSTLGKIIAGLYSPDTGELRVDGAPVGRWDPITAQRSGIVMIAQELSLVTQLSVAENVFLGVEHATAGVLHRDLRKRFEELSDMAAFALDPDAIVGDLRIADRQKVEIMRALARDARVVVMDEPTSSLTADAMAQLHELMRTLTAQGRTIVYVSHFLDAVLEVADRITIMRDGVKIRTSPAEEETKASMVSGMLGREMAVAFPDRVAPVPAEVPPILEADGLMTRTGVNGVSLTVRPGEIVGLLGLIGSGRSEIARAVAGADPLVAGSIRFAGETRTRWSIRKAIAAGVVMVPESRHHEGLVLERSVRENITLAFLGRVSRLGIIQPRKERARAKTLAASLEMRPPRTDLIVSGLSGGNQQKALLGKWLLGDPRLVILDEPTRGVDIGAKTTIYRLITELAARGVGVLLISSEHEEVLNLATRAYTVSRGTVREEVDPSTLEVSRLLASLFETEAEIGATA